MAEPGTVRWCDLTVLSRRDVWVELLLPVPWLVIAALCGALDFGAGLVAATLVVFMIGVRLNHGAVHRTLGLSERTSDVLMVVISVVLGGATHALAHTHRIHHLRCLADDDLEGRAASYGFWQALWRSPLYPLKIHAAALRDGGPALRCWIAAELIAVLLVQTAVWAWSDVAALRLVSLTLLFANAAVPMVGIWAVHRGCRGTAHVARTSRSPWLDGLVAHMFQHEEHHRYPAVPTRRLAELTRRIDAAHGMSTGPRVIDTSNLLFPTRRPVAGR